MLTYKLIILINKSDSKSICINFGHFSFKSEDKSVTSNLEEDDFYDAVDSRSNREESVDDELIKSASYFKFKMELKQIQILLIDDKKVLRRQRHFLGM